MWQKNLAAFASGNIGGNAWVDSSAVSSWLSVAGEFLSTPPELCD